MVALKNAAWIEEFREGVFKDEMEEVLRKIKGFTEKLS
jgi:hypothetical protein